MTISPDVASSTNLGGWINRAGVWAKRPQEEFPEDLERSAISWDESEEGRHIELGISENNLFMALGQFGLTHEMTGEMLFPIGTLYDPLRQAGPRRLPVQRLLRRTVHRRRHAVGGDPGARGRLAPVGRHALHRRGATGARVLRAVLRAGAGVDTPPPRWRTFGRGRSRPTSGSPPRTPTKASSPCPRDTEAREALRRQVIRGAYRLVDRRKDDGYEAGVNDVNVFASGAVVPEAVEASSKLLDEGIYASVINVTGPGAALRRVPGRRPTPPFAASPWTSALPAGRPGRPGAPRPHRDRRRRPPPHPRVARRRPQRAHLPARRHPVSASQATPTTSTGSTK